MSVAADIPAESVHSPSERPQSGGTPIKLVGSPALKERIRALAFEFEAEIMDHTIKKFPPEKWFDGNFVMLLWLGPLQSVTGYDNAPHDPRFEALFETYPDAVQFFDRPKAVVREKVFSFNFKVFIGEKFHSYALPTPIPIGDITRIRLALGYTRPGEELGSLPQATALTRILSYFLLIGNLL
jgi:hypothetical protein